MRKVFFLLIIVISALGWMDSKVIHPAQLEGAAANILVKDMNNPQSKQQIVNGVLDAAVSLDIRSSYIYAVSLFIALSGFIYEWMYLRNIDPVGGAKSSKKNHDVNDEQS